MKSQVRVLGIDDAPFSFRDGKVPLVGVVIRLPNYVEGVMMSECTIDGTDADDAVIEMVNRSRYLDQIELIVIDGAAFGGFNVVDIGAINEATGIPVCTVTRDVPDMNEIRSALQKHFPDWQDRLAKLQTHSVRRMETDTGALFYSVEGLGPASAEQLLRSSLVQGNMPEPVRLAHLIATALVKGESKGNP